MKEPEENIQYICSGCTDEIRREFHSTEHIIEVGDFVKATFVDHDEESIEHMWVKVSKLINQEGSQIIRGVLYNQPALVKNVKYTDVVEVNYSDLLGHIKDNDNE